MQHFLEKIWYSERGWLAMILWPFSLVYQVIISLRSWFIQPQPSAVPLIIVGNLTVGGVGKTPLVIAMAKHLQQKGWRVGVVSRGYGSKIRAFPHIICPQDSASDVGDEPFLIAKNCACPVVIAPKRMEAVRLLRKHYPIDLIISDDGLQHLAMGRTLELVVIDGIRGIGNGFCLPAGPLREPASRLKKVDMVIVNGGAWRKAEKVHEMQVQAGALTHLATGKKIPVESLKEPIIAVAGIGHPQRFFNTLTQLGIAFKPYIFPDHYVFQPEDLALKGETVIMTEKDAVKCIHFAADQWYFLPIEAQLNEDFWQTLESKLPAIHPSISKRNL